MNRTNRAARRRCTPQPHLRRDWGLRRHICTGIARAFRRAAYAMIWPSHEHETTSDGWWYASAMMSSAWPPITRTFSSSRSGPLPCRQTVFFCWHFRVYGRARASLARGHLCTSGGAGAGGRTHPSTHAKSFLSQPAAMMCLRPGCLTPPCQAPPSCSDRAGRCFCRPTRASGCFCCCGTARAFLAHHERSSRTLITNANASANARPWGEQLARPRHAAMKRATRDKFSAQEASGKGGAGAAVDLDVDDAGHFREQLGVLQRL